MIYIDESDEKNVSMSAFVIKVNALTCVSQDLGVVHSSLMFVFLRSSLTGNNNATSYFIDQEESYQRQIIQVQLELWMMFHVCDICLVLKKIPSTVGSMVDKESLR